MRFRRPAPLPWRRPLVAAAVTGVSLPLACQLVPPFHVLTHEFTQLYTVVAAIVCFYVAAYLASALPREGGMSAPTRLSQALTMAAASSLLMATVAFAVMVVANLLGPRCTLVGGAVFFWVTWHPAALLAMVLGVAVGDRQWRWPYQTAVLGALIALTLLHDCAQALWGANVVDLFVGKPLAFDVRADLRIPRVHGLQRLVVIGLSFCLWNLLRWQRGRAEVGTEASAVGRVARLKFGISTLLLALVLIPFGSHVGFGWGHGALHGHLSGEVRTEHFVVRYAPGGDAEIFAEAIANDAEWHWTWLTEQWSFHPEESIWIYVFEGSKELGEHTPTRSSHTMGDSIRVTTRSALRPTLPHELVHALHYQLLGPWMVMQGRGIIEGLAIAFEDGYALHMDAHGRQAAAMEGDTLPRATEVMSLLGFWTVDEHNAYDASGSFVGYLLLQYGWERFEQLQRQGFEEAYGKDLATLDEEWRDFLAGVPVDMSERAAARESFDPVLQPAYSDECCPKLGSPITERSEQANRRWNASDMEGALLLFDELYADDGSPRWANESAQCLMWLRRHREALQRVDVALATDELEEDERYRLLWTRLLCVLGLRDWSELEPTIAALDALEEPTPYRLALWTCLRDPELNAAVALALTDSWYRGRRALEELIGVRPGLVELRYVYALSILGVPEMRRTLGIDPRIRNRVMDVLDLVATTPGLADEYAPDLLGVSDHAIRAGELHFADQICTSLSVHGREPLNRLLADRCADRIRWERAR